MSGVRTDGDELASGVGERVRRLRRAAGMSQTELAGGRFTKEYVSQVERGKTRPSAAALAWLAQQLGTDLTYLEEGLSAGDARSSDTALAAAEQMLEARRYAAAAAAFRDARASLTGLEAPALLFRAQRGEIWARIRLGELEAAGLLLAEAHAVASHPRLTEVDRAELDFLAGVHAYSASDVDEAIARFETALRRAERSGLPCDRLRADVFHWRSRCWRRLRDWEAAREDAERALELADARSDPRQAADAYFQASLVAQREGSWLLARRHAERALELFAGLGDRATVARLLNNLAGLNHLLGSTPRAIEQLREAFSTFVDLDLAPEAGYVLSSLADVHLESGDPVTAEQEARKALLLLGDRVDHMQEIGTAHLALGRSLGAQGRLDEAAASMATAESLFLAARSTSHQADAWIARGDLANRSGDEREAALLFRRAAEALLADRV